MKLIILEGKTTLSGVVSFKQNRDGQLEGASNENVYLLVQDDEDVGKVLDTRFRAKGWDEESLASIAERVADMKPF